MVSAYVIPVDTLIKRLALELETKNIITPPEWSVWVKTGHFKEDKPNDHKKWFYVRSAAVLRKIYTSEPIGVQNLRKKFGKNKNRGSKPDKTSLSSGAIIRLIVQQLETAGLIEKTENQGRKLTSNGKKFVDMLCKEIKEANYPELKHYV